MDICDARERNPKCDSKCFGDLHKTLPLAIPGRNTMHTSLPFCLPREDGILKLRKDFRSGATYCRISSGRRTLISNQGLLRARRIHSARPQCVPLQAAAKRRDTNWADQRTATRYFLCRNGKYGWHTKLHHGPNPSTPQCVLRRAIRGVLDRRQQNDPGALPP
jgi:hypothetical protein